MSTGPMKITRKDAYQVCPEWVLLADISAQAVRLYLVLSKASDNETQTHHWGRKKIAEAMRLKSPRSVDRYLGELAAIGAVKIRPQFKDNRQTTNEYQVITVDPSQYSERGVADLNTPVGADLNTHGGAENCSQSYNLHELKTSTNSPAAAGAPASRRKPRRALPTDWSPNTRHQQTAQTRNLDLTREAQAFRNHAESVDRRLADWDKGFDNWLLKAHPANQQPPWKVDNSLNPFDRSNHG